MTQIRPPTRRRKDGSAASTYPWKRSRRLEYPSHLLSQASLLSREGEPVVLGQDDKPFCPNLSRVRTNLFWDRRQNLLSRLLSQVASLPLGQMGQMGQEV